MPSMTGIRISPRRQGGPLASRIGYGARGADLKSITARVLSTKSGETSQPSPPVLATIQSGIARLSSGIRSSSTVPPPRSA